MTKLFLNNGVPSVKWRDSKGILHTCAEESYTKIFKQAMTETKFADKHREEMVDKLQDKEKKVDEIATADEIKQKRLEEMKAEIRKEIQDLDDDEIEKIKESLKAEIEELKNNPNDDDKQQSKSASRNLEFVGYENSRSNKSGSNLEYVGLNNREAKSNYHVLRYNMNSTDSQDGDSLLILMGSTK